MWISCAKTVDFTGNFNRPSAPASNPFLKPKFVAEIPIKELGMKTNATPQIERFK